MSFSAASTKQKRHLKYYRFYVTKTTSETLSFFCNKTTSKIFLLSRLSTIIFPTRWQTILLQWENVSALICSALNKVIKVICCKAWHCISVYIPGWASCNSINYILKSLLSAQLLQVKSISFHPNKLQLLLVGLPQLLLQLLLAALPQLLLDASSSSSSAGFPWSHPQFNKCKPGQRTWEA